jgi:hypothetical protein
METPWFVLEWFRRMPYHQIAELTVWMDTQADVKLAFEKAIGEALAEDENEPAVVNPVDTMSCVDEDPSWY